MFVHDRLTGTTQGVVADQPSSFVVISPDGSTVAMDDRDALGVIVHDRLDGTTLQAVAPSASRTGDARVDGVALSADAGHVAFG